MTTTAALLLAAFLAIAAVDWAAVHAQVKWVEYVCKPGCMVVLIGAAVALDPADDGARTALVIALVLSLAGDVFLMVRGDRAELFIAGLASFLCAHLAYVNAFVLDGVGRGLALGAVVALVVVGAVGLPLIAAVRRGEEPELVRPVAGYVGVIALMMTAAFGTGDWAAQAGAVLFAGSDSLIARDRFVRHAPWAPLAIIVSYHLAQALLVVSFAQG